MRQTSLSSPVRKRQISIPSLLYPSVISDRDRSLSYQTETDLCHSALFSVISYQKGRDVYIIFLSYRKRQVYFIRLASHKAIALYVRKGQICLLRKTQISISSLFNRALISERDSALFHHSCIALSYQISISPVSFFAAHVICYIL